MLCSVRVSNVMLTWKQSARNLNICTHLHGTYALCIEYKIKSAQNYFYSAPSCVLTPDLYGHTN